MTKKIRKFFNDRGEEVGAEVAEYAIELEFSKKGRLLRSKRYEVVKKK